MPYLGNAPAEAYSQISYQDLTGGSGTSFTLDYPAGSAGEIEVFVNNVRQEPTVAYTVSGTSLTMTGSIAATDDFYVVFQGKAEKSGTIPEKQTDGTYVFPDDVTVSGNITSTGVDVTGTITPSGGIYLGGTGSANLLQDYETGTWTPVFQNVAAPTYTVQTGNYTKIGRMVFVSIIIEYSGLNTADSSSLAITLPFTASASGVFHLAENSSNTGFAGSNTISLIGSTGGGASILGFGSTGDYDDGDYNSGNWAASGALRFYGSYPAS